MEKVDVVDENLKNLYSVTRNEAHKKGLLHPVITVEVINFKREWLLVKQASHKQNPGKFVSPVVGHIKAGESEINALKRETKEELGLTNFKYKRIGQAIYTNLVSNRQVKIYFIIYEIYSDQEPILNDESVEFKRFSKEEIKKLLKKKPTYFNDPFHFIVKTFYKKYFS